MDCLECKASLWPENPEVAQYDPHRKRWLRPLCQGCPNAYQKEYDELADRVGNLEAISAQPGRIPRQYYGQFQQMRGELAYLRNKICELTGLAPQKPKLSQGVKL